MPDSIISKSLLNNVLKNINNDLAALRQDFKKLSEYVTVLNLKSEEIQSFKSELKEITLKLDTISNKIFELEKSREVLQTLIREVDKDGKSFDTIANLTFNQKIKELETDIKQSKVSVFALQKIVALLFALLGIFIYISGQMTKFLETLESLVKRFF